MENLRLHLFPGILQQYMTLITLALVRNSATDTSVCGIEKELRKNIYFRIV